MSDGHEIAARRSCEMWRTRSWDDWEIGGGAGAAPAAAGSGPAARLLRAPVACCTRATIVMDGPFAETKELAISPTATGRDVS